MKVIRKHSEMLDIFPEYFYSKTIEDTKLSFYTHFQVVESNKIVLYSFITDAIILLDLEEYNAILEMNFETKVSLLHTLLKNGFVINKDIDEFELLMRHRKNMIESKSKTFKAVILPTTDCNARCHYCIGENNRRMDMTLDTAKQVVNFLVKEVRGYESLRFDWYGGEPLIKKEIISYVCNEVKHRLQNLYFTSVITTNLTMFDEELLVEAINSWHIKKVNVTLDGTEIEHNKRKKYLDNSFNGYAHTIKCIQMLLENEVVVFCRFNIDKNNFSDLKIVLDELKLFFSNKFFYFFVSPLRGDDIHDEYFSIFEYNNLFYKTGVLFEEKGLHNAIDSFVPKAMRGVCLAKNINCCVIGPNGLLYRCNLGDLSETSATGSVFEGFLKNNQYTHFMKIDLEEKCKNCKYLPICQGGCPTQALNASASNSQCNKFRFKIEALSNLLDKFYA